MTTTTKSPEVRHLPTNLSLVADAGERVRSMVQANKDPRGFHAAYTGYTEEQLQAAFSLVQNAENWKYAIHTEVLNVPAASVGQFIALMLAAVPFFVGSIPTFLVVSGLDGAFVKVTVSAVGYYHSIGS